MPEAIKPMITMIKGITTAHNVEGDWRLSTVIQRDNTSAAYVVVVEVNDPEWHIEAKHYCVPEQEEALLAHRIINAYDKGLQLARAEASKTYPIEIDTDDLLPDEDAEPVPPSEESLELNRLRDALETECVATWQARGWSFTQNEETGVQHYATPLGTLTLTPLGNTNLVFNTMHDGASRKRYLVDATSRVTEDAEFWTTELGGPGCSWIDVVLGGIWSSGETPGVASLVDWINRLAEDKRLLSPENLTLSRLCSFLGEWSVRSADVFATEAEAQEAARTRTTDGIPHRAARFTPREAFAQIMAIGKMGENNAIS